MDFSENVQIFKKVGTNLPSDGLYKQILIFICNVIFLCDNIL